MEACITIHRHYQINDCAIDHLMNDTYFLRNQIKQKFLRSEHIQQFLDEFDVIVHGEIRFKADIGEPLLRCHVDSKVFILNR